MGVEANFGVIDADGVLPILKPIIIRIKKLMLMIFLLLLKGTLFIQITLTQAGLMREWGI